MKKTKIVAYSAICAALTFVATFAISVPIPIMNGYIHPGDAVIFITSCMLGGLPALIAGGIGSALSDIALGYAYFAPATLLIKGLCGLSCGLLFTLLKKHKITAYILASFFMSAIILGGYFLATLTIFNLELAAASLIPNLIQCAVSLGIAVPASLVLKKILPDGAKPKLE